ncbi:MAG: 16S rRNA (guanine(527)-N(7))-methyltransferase RsmG [Clostridium sp.]|jgi:16S rRNA (guanine527-N7)-methyltransferase|nr:16S rRNA (guanine(527)-N(7))-methyltransferase RsmG [Clostridium sp.]
MTHFDENEFQTILTKQQITLSDHQRLQFAKYYALLLEWNERMNLTTILKPREVMVKHYLDSLSLMHFDKLIPDATLIDVGTGAGFPGIPLKILNPSWKITLLDAVSKKLQFLKAVIETLGLEGIATTHARAEDLAHQRGYRESFDLCTSRAVANLSTLSEYCLPFVRKDGYFVAYKTETVHDELDQAKSAIKLFGGELIQVIPYELPEFSYDRTLAVIHKRKSTPHQYPRKAGIPSKTPF